MDNPPPKDSPDTNPQQSQLQNLTLAQLNAAAASLKATSNNTADLEVYRAANEQYTAVQDRISELLLIQLAADTAQMQVLMAPMQKAKGDLDAVLKTLAKASDLVAQVAKYLQAVDDLIAAAKIAATL
jgi:hypothetical protein